jgi:hypothetical protein
MRRRGKIPLAMRRWLITAPSILSLLSLLLCMAMAVLWVRSYHAYDSMQAGASLSFWSIDSHRGAIGFRWETDRSPDIARLWRERSRRRAVALRSWPVQQPTPLFEECRWHALGFGGHVYDISHLFVVRNGQALTHSRLLVVPDAFLITMFAVLPVLWLGRRAVRGRLARHGRCAFCGYDVIPSPSRPRAMP